MKDGVIQQVDTPENLYQTPCNLFVAGFIGSPSMNFTDADVIQKNGKLTLNFHGHEITVPEGKADALKPYVGKTVVIGIRPEDIHDEQVFLESSKESIINAEIRVREMLGAVIFLYFDIDTTTFTARVNPRSTANVGATIQVAFDMGKLHVFDKETEEVIFN